MQIHSLLLLAVQVFTSILVIGFTSSSSFIRLASLPCITACAWLAISECIKCMVRSSWAALIGGYSISYLYQYIDVALLSRWSFEIDGPTSGFASRLTPPLNTKKEEVDNSKDVAEAIEAPPQRSWYAQLVFGTTSMFSFRHIGTLYQARNVPYFSNLEPSYAPSRLTFLRQTIMTVMISYLVLDVLNSTADPNIANKYLSLQKIPFFTRARDISIEELVIRFFTTLCLGISVRCVQQGVYGVVAIASVGLGFYEPQAWPPLYGPLSEAYSLRKLWSCVWHQTNTPKFLSISNFILHDILNLPHGKAVVRYLRLLFVFLASGIMHVSIDIAAGISLRQSGAMRFFYTQAAGILIEDTAIKMYCYVLASDKNRRLVRKEKIVGYFWVALFMTWSTPVYLYPMLYRSRAGLNDSVIPVSIVGKLRDGKW